MASLISKLNKFLIYESEMEMSLLVVEDAMAAFLHIVDFFAFHFSNGVELGESQCLGSCCI